MKRPTKRPPSPAAEAATLRAQGLTVDTVADALEMIGQEIWLPVAGWPYRVSSAGRVEGPSGLILKPRAHSNGYLRVSLCDNSGSPTDAYIHRLVCAAFHGSAPEETMHADHINNNRADNRAANLRWLTPEENRALRNTPSGEGHANTKLTETDIKTIRDAGFKKGQDAILAEQLGVSRETVRDVRLNKAWKATIEVLASDRVVTSTDNNPPSPFDEAKQRIEDLREEAKQWLDGEPIKDGVQAAAVAKLLNNMRQARKAADDARKLENAPFDEGKAEVQARYNPLLKIADQTTDAAKGAQTKYLNEQDAKIRAEAARLRQLADEENARVAAAALAAHKQGNLEAIEKADQELEDAKLREAEARRMENAKAQVKGGGRTIAQRTVKTGKITDKQAFGRWVWGARPDDMNAFLFNVAQAEARAGTICPGLEIVETKVAV